MRGSAQRGRKVLAAFMIGVSLGGCAVVERVASTPSITEVPADPDAVTLPPSPTATTPEPARSSPPGGPTLPVPGPLAATERLAVIDSLGIGLAAPILFMDIDPERYAPESAALDELARTFGMSTDALRRGLLDPVDRLIAGEGDDGRPASVVVARTDLDALPSRSFVRAELQSSMGVDVLGFSQVSTPAGRGVLTVYALPGDRPSVYGQVLHVETTAGVVQVAVTAGSAAEAKRLTTRVLRTIRALE